MTLMMSRPAPRRFASIQIWAKSAFFIGLLAFSAWNFTRSDALARAETAYRRSDFATALRLAKEHCSRRPWSRDAARLAAQCLSRLDFPDAAEPYYRKAGALDLKEANVRAYAILRANRREDAIAALQEILKSDPRDLTALRRLGAVYMTQARWTDAIAVGNNLIGVPGGEIVGQTMLATANHEAGEPELAIAHSEAVIRLDPELSSEWIAREQFLAALAADLMKTGRASEARRYLQQILDRREYANTWFSMGQAFRQDGAADEAEQCWRRAVEIAPSYPAAWLELGRLALERNRLQEAREALERAIALEPTLADAYYSLAAAHRRLGNRDEARKAQKAWDSLKQSHGHTQTGMGATSRVLP
jgi:tetratricopeptide (TPR) repeat protein